MRLILLCALLLLTGCANPYRANYVSTFDRWPGAAGLFDTAAAPAPPKLVAATDMQQDALALLESGYLMIGRATFRSARIDERQALALAQEVGADLVLASQEYMNTVTQSIPMTQWLPERRYTTTERVSYQPHPDSTPLISERTITQTIQGEAYVEYVPQTTDYYQYAATFWRKAKPMHFGVLVQRLDEATRQRLQTNRGVIVKAVVSRTPAFDADILRGDIITQFNGRPVADPQDFFAQVRAHAGQRVTVRLVRGSSTLDVPLTLQRGD